MPDPLATALAGIGELARDGVAERAAAVDAARSFPDQTLRELAEAGALGLLVPPEHGGAGGGLEALAEACEPLGASCASTAMVFLMHSVAASTVAKGGGERADAYLRSMATGEALATLAFSERGAGAHFYSPELRADRANGGLRISGRKSFVTSGGHADLYLVLVQVEGEEALGCYAIDRGRTGVAFEGEWTGLGMAGNASVAMALDGVQVDPAELIGQPGGGLALVFDVVAPFFLVGLAAVNVGIAQAAAASATRHAAERAYPDGTKLAEIQAIQHALARMDIEVRQARLLVREAARLGDAGDEGALVPIMEAKVAATEAAVSVTQTALDTCGGQAYTPSLPIERHLRDARAGSVMAPTNAVLRNWIGKALAGLPVP